MDEVKKTYRLQNLVITALFLGLIVTYAVMENRANGLRKDYDTRFETLNQIISDLQSELDLHQTKLEDLEQAYDVQSDYIQELEELLYQHDIMIDDLFDYFEPDEDADIPLDWITSTETLPVNLTTFEEMDSDDSIAVNATSIVWTEMDRSLERRLYTELSESQKHAHITEFNFEINRFHNNDLFNRRIVSFWMLAKTVEIGPTGGRSFTQLYAEEVGDSESAFKLVMHQRVDGPNSFVSIGPVLDVNQTYKARIIYYNQLLKYEIWSGDAFDDLIYTMSTVETIPQDYQYLMFSIMVVNNNDQTIWSSGEVSGIELSE